MTIIVSNLNKFTNFFTGRFLSKFAVKRILNIPPRLAYVATLPCETLMSAKQAINDKLATYLSCGGVVSKKIKSVNIWQSYKQERDCLVHFVRLANALLKDETPVLARCAKCMRQPRSEDTLLDFITAIVT